MNVCVSAAGRAGTAAIVRGTAARVDTIVVLQDHLRAARVERHVCVVVGAVGARIGLEEEGKRDRELVRLEVARHH